MAGETKRAELGPLVALPTARHARVEHGAGPSLPSTRSCAWIAVVEAHHVAIRSSFHASMKAENWFQLRIVGVTAIKEPGSGRALFLSLGAAGQGDFILVYGGVAVATTDHIDVLRTQQGREHRAQQVKRRDIRASPRAGTHRRFCGRRGFLEEGQPTLPLGACPTTPRVG